MIIMGLRGVTYTKANSVFHCPTCGPDTGCRHRRVRRFFTLYFVPVIPLNLAGEYVECSRCKGTYRTEALHGISDAQAGKMMAEFERAALRIMVEMMCADGDVAPAEIAAIQQIFSTISPNEVSEEDIADEIGRAADSDESLESVVRRMGAMLNAQGRETVFKAALMVAAADGRFEEGEAQMLLRIGVAMDMTPSHINGVIASFSEMAGRAHAEAAAG